MEPTSLDVDNAAPGLSEQLCGWKIRAKKTKTSIVLQSKLQMWDFSVHTSAPLLAEKYPKKRPDWNLPKRILRGPKVSGTDEIQLEF